MRQPYLNFVILHLLVLVIYTGDAMNTMTIYLAIQELWFYRGLNGTLTLPPSHL